MKTLKYIGAALMVAVLGCKQDPTVEEMERLGKVSGYTASYVLNNQVKVDDATRNGIVAVMNEVEKYVPETNATYVATWTPIAQAFVDKGVAEGKITQAVADRVMKDFGYVVGLLDRYIEKKGIAGKKKLIDVFIHSFFREFLANFKPVNGMFATSAMPEELDKETIEILNDLIK